MRALDRHPVLLALASFALGAATVMAIFYFGLGSWLTLPLF